MKAKMAVGCVLMSLSAACHAGVDTAEALAQQAITAVNNADAEALEALMLNAETSSKLLKCADENPVQARVDKIVKNFTVFAEQAKLQGKSMSAEYLSISKTDITPYKAGESLETCEVLQNFEEHRLRVVMNLTRAGITHEDDQKFGAIKVDDKYYLTKI